MATRTYWPEISNALYKALVVLSRYSQQCIKAVGFGSQFATDLLALLNALSTFFGLYARYMEAR